jgi:uncharacterized RDD family membrane protein YckC
MYEGVLLFGVLMAAGLVYGVITQQRHALVGSTGLKVFLFLVLGVYFVYFWHRRGQTLAMLTWHIKLVGPGGAPVGVLRAVCRYMLSWLWFIPALALFYFWGLKGGGPFTVVLVAGILAYAGLSRLRPDRQFLHDAACQTRLISALPPVKSPKSTQSARNAKARQRTETDGGQA